MFREIRISSLQLTQKLSITSEKADFECQQKQREHLLRSACPLPLSLRAAGGENLTATKDSSCCSQRGSYNRHLTRKGLRTHTPHPQTPSWRRQQHPDTYSRALAQNPNSDQKYNVPQRSKTGNHKHFTYISKLAGKMIGENAQMSLGNVVAHIQKNGKQPPTQISLRVVILTAASSLNLEICWRWEAGR